MSEIVDPKIEAYAADHTVPVPALLEELAEVTRQKTTAPQMMVGRLEGAFLKVLVGLLGARRVVEVGTFTGYSGLWIASALPEGGELITCELSPEHAAIARGFFEKSPDGKKVDLRVGPALETLKTIEAGSVDLIFIDADKVGYSAYYEEGLRILRKGGLVVADNVLWSGRVLDPQEESDRAIVAFNEKVRGDDRVEHVLLTVRDGMMLARKK